MKKTTFIFAILIFLIGCNELKEKNIQNQTQIVNGNKEKIHREDFDSFFLKFSSDSVFQISRIKFPLKKSILDITDELEETKILKNEWDFISFKDNNSSLNGFNYIKTKSDASQVKYEMRGIDNGILIEYIFQKEENEWYLIEIQDLSI